VLELVVFAYVSFFFITETREVMRIGIKAYMTDGYALIIITNIVLFIVIIILESILLVRSDAIMKSDMATLKGPEMINVLVMGEKVLSVYAFNALLTWIRMVKYLDIISKKTKVLSDTIAASATDITVFLVLFFVVYFGFCVAFNVAFGSDIEMYKSIKDCLISIFRTMLGDFDYEAMKAANYVLAPLILVVFVIVVSFVLLNMFMAIIMNNYDRVRDELHDDPDDISMHMRRLMSKKMAAWFPKLHRVFGLTQAESDPKTLTLEDCARIWANDHEALEAAGITCPEDMLEVVDDPSLVGGLSLEDIVLFANQRLTGEEEGSEGDEEKEEEASVSDLLRKVLERTNAIVKEQFKVRSMLSGDAK